MVQPSGLQADVWCRFRVQAGVQRLARLELPSLYWGTVEPQLWRRAVYARIAPARGMDLENRSYVLD